MNDNTLLLLVAELGLLAISLAGLFGGETHLAYGAAGAFSGLLAGHLNGRQQASQAHTKPEN